MIFTPLRLYLLAGMLAHKLLWEALKRRQAGADASGAAAAPRGPTAVRLVKMLILVGFCVQTLVPDVLPISADGAWIRPAGVILYSIGLATAMAARIQLGRNWSDIEVGRVRREHTLISHGIYRYVRHPIYAGDLALVIGLELALNSWLFLLGVALIVPVYRRAVREEASLMERLPEYAEYCRRSKRLIPFVL